MEATIKDKIKQLKSGRLSEEDFYHFLKRFPYEDIGGVKLDFHRRVRRGLPEVIYGKGKSIDQLNRIVERFHKNGEDLLITRTGIEVYQELIKANPQLVYHEKARIITGPKLSAPKFSGSILVLSAGASDEKVAEEAFVSAQYLGNKTEKEYDVGVACIARILDLEKKLNNYTALIVVAGMEGALPSIVAGLTNTPIIAVPTSVGYGSNFKGLSALLSMLNSCSGGVTVVNIDNGFGAAFFATLVNQKYSEAKG